MTTARIVIDSGAFAAGMPLHGSDPAHVRVQVGNVDTNNNINGGGIGVTYTTDEFNKLVGRNSITVTVNPLFVESAQLLRWPQHWKNSLADLVAKGVLIVENPAGTPLTSAAIVAL